MENDKITQFLAFGDSEYIVVGNKIYNRKVKIGKTELEPSLGWTKWKLYSEFINE